MSTNEIILLAIVIIGTILLVFTIYFLYIFFNHKVKKKKVDSIFIPEKLQEEESLLNSMDKKTNIEFNKKEESNTFTNANDIKILKDEKNNNVPLNPFGIDLTKTTHENRDYVKEEEERLKNKFFR